LTNRLSNSHLEIGDLAEGSQKMSGSVEPASPLKTTTVPIVHYEHGVKDTSAEGGIVSRVGTELEGRDNSDAQDASLSVEDTAGVIWATLERMNIVTAQWRGHEAVGQSDE
jgi:hypothetical protein